VLFGMGDCIAQQGIQRKGLKNHDLAATGRMALYGGCKLASINLANTWLEI
jgi:protein Mpv17